MSFVFVSRGLQDVLIMRNIFALLIRLQMTSWSRPIYSSWSYVFETSSRSFQDFLKKTSSKHLQDVSKMFQDVFKTSSWHLQDFFKTSSRKTSRKSVFKTFKTFWRCLQNIFKTSCKDVFNTFSRGIIKLNCSC